MLCRWETTHQCRKPLLCGTRSHGKWKCMWPSNTLSFQRHQNQVQIRLPEVSKQSVPHILPARHYSIWKKYLGLGPNQTKPMSYVVWPYLARPVVDKYPPTGLRYGESLLHTPCTSRQGCREDHGRCHRAHHQGCQGQAMCQGHKTTCDTYRYNWTSHWKMHWHAQSRWQPLTTPRPRHDGAQEDSNPS